MCLAELEKSSIVAEKLTKQVDAHVADLVLHQYMKRAIVTGRAGRPTVQAWYTCQRITQLATDIDDRHEHIA